MYHLFLVAISFSFATVAIAQQAVHLQWKCESKQIIVGGCVTLIIEGHRIPNDLIIESALGKPLRLSSSATRLTSDDKVLFLLWTNMETSKRRENNVQFEPYFSNPGEIKLRLRSSKDDYGTVDVLIIPASKEAAKANEILYPVIDVTSSERFAKLGWIRSLAEDWGSVGDIGPDAISEMERTLPVIMLHPDWKEVVQSLVYYRALQQRVRSIPKNQNGKRIPMPAQEQDIGRIATLIRNSKPTSLFARALQKKSEQHVIDLERGAYGFKLNLSTQPAQSGTDSQPAQTEPEQKINIVVPPSK